MNIAKTPPMGWNSWDCYGAAVNEEQLMGNAQYMAEHLLSYGWEYVVCDIQWYEPNARDTEYNRFAPLVMDSYSRLMPAENRFPSAANGKGFSVIAERIHALGLKFGIHILRGIPRQAVHARCPILGTNTTADKIADPFSICSWNSDMYGVDPYAEGAYAYYRSIFELYASWGVDFIKIDDIACIKASPNNPYAAEAELDLIRKAIDACGRDMVVSLSPGPAPIEKAEHLKHCAQMWRLTDDVWDHWGAIVHMFERCACWYPHVAPGSWPDCDMLPFGHINVNNRRGSNYTKLTHDEQISMMTLWSIFRSPLIMGGELRDNDAFTLSLLTNAEVLRLNKHSYGAHPIFQSQSLIAWLSHDDETGHYLAIFNLTEKNDVFSLALNTHDLTGIYTLRDLWVQKNLGVVTNEIHVLIPSHGAVLYHLMPIENTKEAILC